MAQILLDESTAPSTPSTGKVTLYAKSDGLIYEKDDAGVENAIIGSVATQTLTNKTLTSPKETRTAPTISGGTLTLDLSASSIFDVSLGAAITTLTISNPAASGTAHGFVLTFTADGTARAVTWGASVLWPGGTAPTLTSTNGKKDKFAFVTTDGGTTWHGITVGQNF